MGVGVPLSNPLAVAAAAATPAPPSIRKTTSASMKRRSLQNRRCMLPRITLPLVVLALVATFNSHVAALAPRVTTSASQERATFSSALNDDISSTAAVATPNSKPVADDVAELKKFRRAGEASLADRQSHGSAEDDNALPPSKALAGRSSSTSDGGSSPLPSPFDNLVPSAFQISGGSNSCPNFMTGLLSDPTFKSCYPVSMLIQTSLGFFNAEKQLASIVKVLDATCAANVTKCGDFLETAARNLTSDANCKTEFAQNQAQVLLAYRGLRAYRVLYSAACLRDPATNVYCFANAVTNVSAPSDSYLYFMPYGNALPGGSRPTCNVCTQKTMSIYYDASADRSQPVASEYQDAARQVNTLCGPDFVNSSLPTAKNSGAFPTAIPSFFGLATNTIFILLIFAFVS